MNYQFVVYLTSQYTWFGLGWVMVFNATFNNNSVILWRSVLLVEEAGVPQENHLPAQVTEKHII
jgi:hypothetical protein